MGYDLHLMNFPTVHPWKLSYFLYLCQKKRRQICTQQCPKLFVTSLGNESLHFYGINYMAGTLHMYHSPSPQELESQTRIKVLSNSTGIIHKFTFYMHLVGIAFNNIKAVFFFQVACILLNVCVYIS